MLMAAFLPGVLQAQTQTQQKKVVKQPVTQKQAKLVAPREIQLRLDRGRLASILLGKTNLTHSEWVESGLQFRLGSWESYPDSAARMDAARQLGWGESGLDDLGDWGAFANDDARGQAAAEMILSATQEMQQGFRGMMNDLGIFSDLANYSNPGGGAGDPGGGGSTGGGSGTGGSSSGGSGSGGSGSGSGSGSGGSGSGGSGSGSGGDSSDNLGGLGDDALKLGDTDSGSSIHALFPPRTPTLVQLNCIIGFMLTKDQ